MFFLANTFKCGDIDLPVVVATLVHLIYIVIRIGIPVILLIVGMVDLGKAVVAQKEDEVKKAQGLLIKKVIAAVIVFLLFTLIQFAIDLVDNKDNNNVAMWTCVNQLLSGDAASTCANGTYDEATKTCKCNSGFKLAGSDCVKEDVEEQEQE